MQNLLQEEGVKLSSTRKISNDIKAKDFFGWRVRRLMGRYRNCGRRPDSQELVDGVHYSK